MHGVEAAIEDLVGLALPAVLRDEHAGHNLKQITTGTVGRGLNDGLIAVQTGAVLVSLCLATVTFSLVPSVPYWVAVVSWIIGAAGMGLAFGAVGTLTLELSEPEDQGANVAALQVCDSVGSVVFVGIAGAIYGRALDADAVTAATFTTIWLVMALVAAGGAVAAARIARPQVSV